MKGTIKSKEDMERLFQKGRRSSSYLMAVISSPTSHHQGRCAYAAGKKLGSAPLRNRCKRVMRSVASELGAPWPGYDVVFVARRKVAFEDHGKVVKQARRQLQELGIVEK